VNGLQLSLLPDTKQKPLTPFLKYAGGKTWLAPKLKELYAPYRSTHKWVEPFCGALGATLGVMPENALLNDVNPHLINLYREIELGLQSPSSWLNSKEMFGYIKEIFNSSLDISSSWWRAKAFYYLNRTCFNGLCRFNLKGEFNTPYGKYKKPKLDHDFALYREAFTSWRFFNKSWDEFDWYRDIENLFVYVDPPYDGGFVNYSGAFAWEDQVNLAETLAALDCPIVASNKATDRIVSLYESLNFSVEIVSARRRISGNGDRSPVDEILATKNLVKYYD